MTKIPVVRFAPGVMPQLTPAGVRMLSAIDQASKALGFDLVVTSGRDSHATGQHPKGNAWDLSARYLTPAQVLRLRSLLMHSLGERFTVLYEVPSVEGLDASLIPIAYVNPQATGRHVHLQLRKDLDGEYPPTENTNA